MQDNRNFMIAIALSALILVGYSYLFPAPKRPTTPQTAQQTTKSPAAASKKAEGLPDLGNASPNIPASNGSTKTQSPADTMPIALGRTAALETSKRVTIISPHVKGSIDLRGARLDDLSLSDYKQTVAKGSPDVALLNPAETKHAYFVDFNWGVNGARGPDKNSVWTADKKTLKAGDNVTLTWNNGAGLLFSRTIALDENYMFSITQKVTNSTGSAIKVAQYGRIVRAGRPAGRTYYLSHQGPMWSLDDGIKEFTYKELDDKNKDKKETAKSTDGGWLGISDKYWLVAFIPNPKEKFSVEVFRRGDKKTERFHVNYFHDWTVLQAGASYSETSLLFAGAKKINLLNSYADTLHIKKFNYAIDWGIFYFLVKPMFYLLDLLFQFSGNFGVAILLLTLIVKLSLFPIANKGYKSTNKMKVLQPKMKALKEKYGDDKPKMQQATMELYKKEKVNPVAGCLPMFLQFPVFFALYKVLYITLGMRQAPFFGWIKDLSAPDTMYVTNLFGLIPWEPTGFLALGILPVIMGFTMWLQMQMNPSPGDPMQHKIMMLMPIVFTFMLAQFPVGLVIYWTTSNIFTILQQWVLMRRADPMPVKNKA
ncbi:MAG: membrane protein insertase YidC [Alphaproteobacteria bacterium]|nr:membrane protein insertase YidC [Alphaproteobacteria bacterium]